MTPGYCHVDTYTSSDAHPAVDINGGILYGRFHIINNSGHHMQEKKNEKTLTLPDKGFSGITYTMERYLTGYRMVRTTIVNGRVVDTTYSDYNPRIIIEAKITQAISIDLYNQEKEKV